MGNFAKIAADLEDLVRNSRSKAARAISGPNDENSNMGKLREVEKLFGRGIFN